MRRTSSSRARWTIAAAVGLCLVTAAAVRSAAADEFTSGTKAGEEKNFGGLTFCWCPPGKFTMGSPVTEGGREDDEKQFQVTLTQGFWMGKYEVTQVQYERVLENNPSTSKGDRLPVEDVSWHDAREFCRRLTEMERRAGRLPNGWEYRLPTEAQWEYACRAGTTTAYCSGDDPKQLGEYAWYAGNFDGMVHEVGHKRPNAWGLHDMHGNVWEWCEDWYGNYPNGEVTDPTGAAGGVYRVYRGGIWSITAWDCRSSNRSRYLPTLRSSGLGFRVAAVLSRQLSKAASTKAATTERLPAKPNAFVAGTKAGDEKTFSSVAMTFCWCPAGKFTMGSPETEADRFDGERQFEVTLTQGFWMGKYEVTQEQYERVMSNNPSNFKGDQLPVEAVFWEDATKFCEKLTEMERTAGRLPRGWEYRLPTEAQWEYACRAGTTTAYCFGDDPQEVGDYAWYRLNSEQMTHEVGQKNQMRGACMTCSAMSRSGVRTGTLTTRAVR